MGSEMCIRDRYKGIRWGTEEARRSADYRQAMQEAVKDKIGGTAEEQKAFFERVIAAHPLQFWLEGCAAPCVRGTVISFELKPGAKPVARQPIPMSPYDAMRTEYHLEEWSVQGKIRKIDTTKERLPELATPVFVADQDAKGLLGRMVCAYGPVNKCLELTTFPSADPDGAFRRAAGRSHHTLIDAIWGYT